MQTDPRRRNAVLIVAFLAFLLPARADESPRAARSVHLRWVAEPEVTAFYNEVTVEETVPGSYFMACGFQGGYFGVQQFRAAGAGRVLFSVWDDFTGDDPNAVPGEHQAGVRQRGPGVQVQRFGNEGTGVQSFFGYPWTPGERMRFLVTARRTGDRMAYSGFFYRNDEARWVHVATLDRPVPPSETGLRGLHSFVEDFRRDGRSPGEVRRALFGAGRVCDAEGRWTSLTEAVFTADGNPLKTIDAATAGDRFVLATGGETRQQTGLGQRLRVDGAGVGPPPDRPTLHGEASLIPRPVQLAVGDGVFALDGSLRIHAAADAAVGPARLLADALAKALDRPIPVGADGAPPAEGAITVTLDQALPGDGEERYALSVQPGGIDLRAATAQGLRMGVQTVRQLLPPAALGGLLPFGTVALTLPEVRIEDAPRFSWRGLMLDPCRHFIPMDRVKEFVDVIALHRMRVMHFHLTEDQGWRIAIEKYPRLTEVGSIRAESPRKDDRNTGDGTPYGPYFYTQEELRDLVAYAAERGVTVVPEIEMPGHSAAAIASYPHLGCTGGPYDVRTSWGVEGNIYCAGKDGTFEFLEDVLLEVMDIFPSRIIHVGGDEAPKTLWSRCAHCQRRIQEEGLADEHELQSYFIKRMETFLNAHGRTLIGWDEILEGGLAPNAMVMSWRGESGGIAAAKAGHEVVMSPTSHCYFDYYQSRDPGEPVAIGGYIPLRKVYGYDPVPAVLNEREAARVLGTQGNLWSEYLFTPDKVEYMAFPRACALAEVAWTPRAQREYADFRGRLGHHLRRLDALGIQYREPADELLRVVGTWRSGETRTEPAVMSWPLKGAVDGAGEYRFRFQYTHGGHRLDIAWCVITADGEPVAVDQHPGITGAFDRDHTYVLPVGEWDPAATYRLHAMVRSDGGVDSNGEILLETRRGR